MMISSLARADIRAILKRTLQRGKRRSITIGRSPEEVYNCFRDFEMLPCFMRDIECVKHLGGPYYRFRGSGSRGFFIEWDVDIVEDVPGKRIVWRSAETLDRTSVFSACFRPAPGGRGTELTVSLEEDA